MTVVATDYQIEPALAHALEGVALLTRDLRVELLRVVMQQHPGTDLVELVADLVGMANSVIANSHELLQTEAVVRGIVWPHQADSINFPTMNGALMGVSLADGIDQGRVCSGCAFRLGAPANQCAPTQYDAKDSVDGEHHFLCHEELDASGNGKHGCRGYALAVAAWKRA